MVETPSSKVSCVYVYVAVAYVRGVNWYAADGDAVRKVARLRPNSSTVAGAMTVGAMPTASGRVLRVLVSM